MVITAQQEKWMVSLLVVLQLTHILDFMIIMPLGPQIMADFGLNNDQFGVLVSSYTFCAAISALLSLSYIDRFERRSLLLFFYLFFAVTTLACALAPSYGLLLLARSAAGFFGGAMNAQLQAMVADAVPFERRGRAMGWIMAGFSIATVAGVPASLLLAAHTSWRMPFVVVAAMALVVAALLLWRLPRFVEHLKRQRQHWWHELLAAAKPLNHWQSFGVSVVSAFAAFCVVPFISLVMQGNGYITLEQLPLMYLVGGACTLISTPLIGRAGDRFGLRRVFAWVSVAACAPLLLMTHMPHWPLLGVVLTGALFFVLVPGRMAPLMAILGSASNAQLRGRFLALNQFFQSLAMGLGALLGALLIDHDATGRVVGFGLNGWVAAACCLLAAWWVRLIKFDKPASAASTASVIPSP